MRSPLVLGALLVGVGGCADTAAAVTPVISPYLDFGPTLTSPSVGTPVTGFLGLWDPTPQRFEIAWHRCNEMDCTAVPGATSRTYTPTDDDVGSHLMLTVTAYGASGVGTATTTRSPAIAARVVASAPPPTVVMEPVSATPSAPPAAPAPTSPSPETVRVTRRVNTVYGRRFLLNGTTTASGQVLLIDPSGTVRGRTHAVFGRFRIGAVANRPGSWSVQVGESRAALSVRVRPRVTALLVPGAVRRPGALVVRGRILPGVAGKVVELHYLDPRRGWRVWRQTRTTDGGRLMVARGIPRVPGVDPFRLRVRVAVPADLGWMYQPAVSRTATVRVR